MKLAKLIYKNVLDNLIQNFLRLMSTERANGKIKKKEEENVEKPEEK